MLYTRTYGPNTVSPATVQVDVRSGLPSLTIVGAPDKVTREVVDHVRAIIADALELTDGRTTADAAELLTQRVTVRFYGFEPAEYRYTAALRIIGTVLDPLGSTVAL